MENMSPGFAKKFNLFVTNSLPLVEAAEEGDYAKVEEALSGMDNDSAPGLGDDDFRLVALTRAAENSHDKVVELILNRCPTIPLKILTEKVQSELDITLLHIAAWTGQARAVRDMKEGLGTDKGETTDVNVRTKGGITPLQMASFRGHLATVNTLLEWPKVVLDAVTAEGFTALHMAADAGHAEVVQALLTACRKAIAGGMVSQDFINAKDCLGRTALHYACRNGHSAVVKVLLAAPEIDVNPKDEIAKFTPLHLAAWMLGDHVDVVKLLINHVHIQVNVRIASINIEEVTLEEKEKVPWKLLRPRLVDATVKSTMVFEREGFPKKGDTPLHLAAEVENVGVVTELLKHNSIEVNATEEQYGMTALHAAALWGRNLDVLSKLLLDQEVNVMLRTKGLRFYPDRYAQCEAMTVVHIAAYRGQPDIVEKLLCDIRTSLLLNTKTGDCNFVLNGHHYKGLTSLHIATYFGHEQVCMMLLSHAKVNVNPPTEFHILKNPERCRSGGHAQHSTAYKDQLLVLQQMLSGHGTDPSRVEALMKLLTGPRVGGAHLQAFRHFIVSAGPEMSASTRVEALIKILSNPKMIAMQSAPPPEFRRLQHADRCYSDMTPFHMAAHRGQVHVVARMLNHASVEHNAQTSTGDTVLHIAIHERRTHVIKGLCGYRKLQANLKNSEKNTALQLVWYEWQEAMDCLLERKDVRLFMETLYKEKESFQNAANALIVGGSLIASVTFGGFLQPPIGMAFESYRAWAVRAFWSFNTLSFFFAVYTLVLSIRIVMPKPEHFIEQEVKKLRRGIAFTSSSLTISTAFVIGAFVTASLGNLPPKTFASMLLSTLLGGLFIILFAVIPLMKDYLEWFEEVVQRYWQYRTPGAHGLLLDISTWMHRTVKKTFSKRKKKPKPHNYLTPQTIEEDPPGPREARHPHRMLPFSPQPSIFSINRSMNLKARISDNTLVRHVGIAHRRFPSF